MKEVIICVKCEVPDEWTDEDIIYEFNRLTESWETSDFGNPSIGILKYEESI